MQHIAINEDTSILETAAGLVSKEEVLQHLQSWLSTDQQLEWFEDFCREYDLDYDQEDYLPGPEDTHEDIYGW